MIKQTAARPRFLFYATAVFGLLACVWALLLLMRSLAPSADVDTEPLVQVDLASLVPGEPLYLSHNQTPIVVLRLTDDQITHARDTSLDHLRDPLARHDMLLPDALASFENRAIDTDGAPDGVYVVMTAICDHLGIVPDYVDMEAGVAWFCFRGAERFDALGRILSGLAQQNLSIPAHRMSEAGELILIDTLQPLSEADLDRVLYGAPD